VTVSSTTNKHSYNGNGSQTAFAYTFKIFVAADIQVYLNGVLKTINTHYTLSNVGLTGGGNVTFTSGSVPSAATGNVILLRSLALTQGVDLINYGAFDANIIESAYDKLTMMVQQLQEEVSRSIRFSATVYDGGTQEISDTVANRASKVLAYDSAGNISIASELGEWQGNWATSTAFAARDLVLDSATNNVYICLVGHTSGTLSSDVSASKWALVINATAVAASATTATTKASEAASSATAAANSASTSTTQANTSTAQASIATTKANTATTQANTATTKASTATTKASEAASSATASANSATAGANSASAGSTSATNSANSATAAASSASTASTKASEATTNGAAQVTLATAQVTLATAQSAISTTKAGQAASSATASANSATASANSATAGANSATAAASSATNAAASFDSFDDRYLGAKGSVPATDNDSNSLIVGALYFNTSSQVMSVWNGSAWAVIAPSAANQANVDIVAGNIVYSEDLGSITAAVTTATGNSIDTVGGAIANVNTVAGAVANVNTVGAGIANVNTVGSGIANVNTVAGSIADVNRYANEYKISSSAPAGPSTGDLWYDSTANVLKYYTGSAFSGIISGITSVVADTSPQLGGALDGQNNNMTNIGTISGANLQLDFGGLT